MKKISWRRIRNGLNKAVFNRHFWEAADLAFSETCNYTKNTARLVFGFRPEAGVINIRILPDGVSVSNPDIGHRAKRAILRKVGRLLRDNGMKLRLGRAEEILTWKTPTYSDTLVPELEASDANIVLTNAHLEYLGWKIVPS